MIIFKDMQELKQPVASSREIWQVLVAILNIEIEYRKAISSVYQNGSM